MRHAHRGLDHTDSTPLFRPARPDVPPPETRPKTWAPGHFSPLFSIPVTRYRVTGVHVRPDNCHLSFDHDLLRFSLGLSPSDHNPIYIDYSSIKHVDIQEVPRKEPKPNEIMGYPHLRENETECFGGSASLIKLTDGHKLAEIRYGNAFELSILYISALPADLDSLKELIASLNSEENVAKFATHVRYDRWVHRKMVEALGLGDHDRNKDFQFREFKVILSDFLNINLSEKYRDWWQEFSNSSAGTMNLQKLQEFFHAFMLDTYLLKNVILDGYTCGKQGLSIEQFKKFCRRVQKQEISDEKRKFVLGKRVSGRTVSKKESKVPIRDFYTMLFSRENDIFDKKKTDNMAYALNYYWINSSHNTYLMGHQMTGNSSVEAYIRALLQGCRCVELDCLDGPNNEPIVWHQNTLCTKIKLLDVLKAINRFAFVTSDYPVILSIENHLCIDQQIVMASMMKSIFKSKLVSYNLFPQDPGLPSPDALKKKILVKNKKIQENSMDEEDDADEPDENDEEFQNDPCYASIQDIQNETVPEPGETKKFSVYLNDEIDGELYSYCQVAFQGSFLHVKEERDRLSQNKEMRQHGCNSWYFGSISRDTSEEVVKDFILSRYVNYGMDQNDAIGSFLVRRSGTPMTGLYNIVVTVWVGNAVKHVKIKSETNELTGRPKFYLEPSQMFNSVPEFINFYHVRQDIPQSAYFKYPIPNSQHYVKKLWYKGDMDREKAQTLLLTPPLMTGKFLIRDRIVKDRKVGFTVSFLMPKDFNDATKGHIVQHLTAKEVGAYVKIKENLKFWSLNHLVEHFTKNPITNEGSVKLTMICKDGAHTVSNSSDSDSLTIELNESYPYEDPAQKLKVLLLKGFKLHNAVRFQEQKKEFYKADFGTRKGIKVPEEIANVVKDETPFGNQLKTKILIEKQAPIMSTKSEFFGFSTPISRITMKFSSNKEVHHFARLFTEAATHSSGGGHDAARKGLSKELSDLVIYCQAVKVPKPFAPAKIQLMEPYHMCSFTELTIDKFAKNRVDYMNLGRFCDQQLGRMYPSWKRMDSSNYNPLLPWAYGMQLVALNFQTPDLPMQLNHGMFTRNQHKGYILKPTFLRKEQYDPNNLKSYVADASPEVITIKILTGRLISLPKHWNKTGCYVTVLLHGIGPGQTVQKKSTVDRKPGISPKWYQDLNSNTMKFEVGFPQLAMLQFALYSYSNELLGQRCVPVDYIREGYRSVILHNVYGEELELAALLVHVEKEPWTVYESCNRQDQNNQRESQLQKKATDLAAVIHSNIKYGKAAVEHLTDQQRSLEMYLSELFNLKYSDSFINALENPMGALASFSGSSTF